MANRLIAANLATAGCAVCTDANGMLVPYTAGGGSIMVEGAGCNSTLRCGVSNTACGPYGFTGGGQCNINGGLATSILGGTNNITSQYTTTTYNITNSNYYGGLQLDSCYGDVMSIFPDGSSVTLNSTSAVCSNSTGYYE